MLRCKRTISITSLQAKASSTQIAFHLLSRELSTLFKFNLPHNLRLPDCSDRQKQSHLRVLWKKKKPHHLLLQNHICLLTVLPKLLLVSSIINISIMYMSNWPAGASTAACQPFLPPHWVARANACLCVFAWDCRRK